jgi:hypothetical protein
MSKSNRFSANYDVREICWRAVGLDRAISSLGHTVTFILGRQARDEFIRRSRLKRAANTPKKAQIALTRREKVLLDSEIL